METSLWELTDHNASYLLSTYALEILLLTYLITYLLTYLRTCSSAFECEISVVFLPSTAVSHQRCVYGQSMCLCARDYIHKNVSEHNILTNHLRGCHQIYNFGAVVDKDELIRF